MDKLKEWLGLLWFYLFKMPKNIKKFKAFKLDIMNEESVYASKYNSLGLKSNESKTSVYKRLELLESEELYLDYYSKVAKIKSMLKPIVDYFLFDLQWSEYLTYEITHVVDEEDLSAAIPTYIVIFSFVPYPSPIEGKTYLDYVKGYKIAWAWTIGIVLAAMAAIGYLVYSYGI